MNRKLLVIGALPHKGKGSTFGGVTVLNKRFLEFLEGSEVDFNFITLNKFHFRFSGLLNSIYFFLILLFKLKGVSHVLFNATYKGIYYISPLVYILTKIFKKKFIIRIFAGNLDQSLQNTNKLNRFIVDKTILKSDFIFVETKHLIDFLKRRGCENVFWYPNVRPKIITKNNIPKYNSKFVFIGHVKESKGIKEIIEASKIIGEDYCIDVYGPFTDGSCSTNDFAVSNVDYKGIISPDDVINTLMRYDILLLPTFHNGEGYPGIIIEAFSIGMPVIASKWRAIPEIVNNNNGILITPKNSQELAKSMRMMDEKLHKKLSLGAINSFKNFEEKSVYQKIIKIINN